MIEQNPIVFYDLRIDFNYRAAGNANGDGNVQGTRTTLTFRIPIDINSQCRCQMTMRNIRLLIQHTSTEIPFKVSHKAVFCLRRELPRCQIIITIVISCTRVQYVYVSEIHKAWQLYSLLLWNYYCHYTTYVAYERIYLNLYVTCLCITSIFYYLSIWFEFRFGENGANICTHVSSPE